MKKWKLIAIISSVLVVAAIATTLVIIFTKKPAEEKIISDYKYPSVQPSLSNKDDAYITLGNRKITNEELYNTAILSYGLNALNDAIDEKLLKDITYTEDEFNNHKKEVFATYNSIDEDEVDFENADQINQYEKQMAIQGYHNSEEMDAAIALDLKRTKYAEGEFEKLLTAYTPTEAQPLFYGTSQIEAAIEALYPSTAKAIYITFRSEAEANKAILASGLKDAKTKDEVINAFVTLYNLVNVTPIDAETLPTYTQSELSSISSTISTAVFNTLKDIESCDKLTDAYLSTPKKYMSGYYYIALKVNTVKSLTATDYINGVKANSTEENILKVSKKLYDQTFNASIISAYLYELRCNKNIKIFDERLDYAFKTTSDSQLSYLEDTTAKYEMTTEENATYVATLDGISITADELFTILSKRYGTLVVVQFMNFYMFFNDAYSNVYNYETKTKGDQFDKMFEETVEYLRSDLEAGNFVEYGFESTYGWENFVHDYFGVTDINEAVLVGDAYSNALEKFTAAMYNVTSNEAIQIYEKLVNLYVDKSISEKDYEDFVATIDKDLYENTILYQICKNFHDYFSVQATTINAYIDVNGDGKNDELTADDKIAMATLVEAIYLLAKTNPSKVESIKGTDAKDDLAKLILQALQSNQYSPISTLTGDLDNRIKTLVSIYNNSSLNDSVFGPYKKIGIRFDLNTSITYTDQSATGAFKDTLKGLWNDILKGNLKLDNNEVVTFPYAEEVNSIVTAIEADFNGSYYTVPTLHDEENSLTKIILTGATNATWYRYTEEYQEICPSIERLEILVRYYLLSLENDEEYTKEEKEFVAKNAPATYESNYSTNNIVPVYEYLVSDEVLQELVYNIRLNFINNGTFKFTNLALKDECLKLMDLIYNE